MSKTIDILTLQTRAASLGGKLLSFKYTSCSEMLEWQCAKGHTWITSWNCVRSHWCPTCDGQTKPNISSLVEYANSKGGKLLSSVYINARKPLLWECQMGHQWSAPWGTINTGGSWCPHCCLNNKKYTLGHLQAFAGIKKGSLLSNTYYNCKANLLWKCSKGHEWLATWENIRRDRWCPYCSYCKTEELCRNILNTLLNITFKKQAIFYKSNKYVFDGYNKEYKVAFEYHGYQHYIFPNRFHKTELIFNAAKKRDRDKEQYCRENNIKLIIIPHTVSDKLDVYIKQQLIFQNITV